MDGFIVEQSLDVGGETAGGIVTPRAVLLQRLHYNPVELTANQGSKLLRFGPSIRCDIDLKCNSAFDRLGLLGHVDDAHPAFTELLKQLVTCRPTLGFYSQCENGRKKVKQKIGDY